MPRTPLDHYVPKSYLRGFTPGHLQGKKEGTLFQHNIFSGAVSLLSINDYVACEPEFYANHPVDKHWSQTVEQRWPTVRTRLRDRETALDLLDELFWFLSAQLMRTEHFMNNVAEHLSRRKAKVQTITEPDGSTWTDIIYDMTHTGEVMNHVAAMWPGCRQGMEEDYEWTLYHSA